MVTTITVTTVTTIAAMGLAASFGVLGSLLLIGFLAGKRLLTTNISNKQQFLARSLNIGIIPLLMSFVVLVVIKILEVLG